MQRYVLKFGGTPASRPENWKKILGIIDSYSSKGAVCVVFSAPGRRDEGDNKVTDLLINVCNARAKMDDWNWWLNQVQERFQAFLTELNFEFDLDAEFEKIRDYITNGCSPDMILSRGEYLCAKMFARYAGVDFTDSYDHVRIVGGELDLDAPVNLSLDTVGKVCVLTGFYARGESGEIVTLSRGGSDAIAAKVAKQTYATLVRISDSALRVTDNKIVEDAEIIEYVTYTELSDIVTMVPSVMHPMAMAICEQFKVPTVIKDFNDPFGDATTIVECREDGRDIVGINLKKGYLDICLTQSGIGPKCGYIAAFSGILADFGLSVGNPSGGNNSMSFVIHGSEFQKNNCSIEEVVSVVQGYHKFRSPEVHVRKNIAHILINGNMSGQYGYLHRASGALTMSQINIKGGESPINEGLISFYVAEQDGEKAVQALYDEFV